jgi:hypothetical protein
VNGTEKRNSLRAGSRAPRVVTTPHGRVTRTLGGSGTRAGAFYALSATSRPSVRGCMTLACPAHQMRAASVLLAAFVALAFSQRAAAGAVLACPSSGMSSGGTCYAGRLRRHHAAHHTLRGYVHVHLHRH